MINQKIVQEFHRIAAENGGVLHASDVVRAARDKRSLLHSRFEWDNNKAAEEHRLWQARQLIAVTVQFVEQTQPPTVAKVFISLMEDRHNGGGYRPLELVMASEHGRQSLLEDALNEMRRFQKKYSDLRVLSEVFAAMQTAMAKHSSRPRKRLQPQAQT